MLLSAIIAVGCSSTSKTSTTTPPVSTPGATTFGETTPAPGATTPAPASTLAGASTNDVQVPASGCCRPGPGVLLTNVSVTHLAGFDQVVFEFSAPLTNYHVRYVPLPVKQDPSDNTVVLPGDSALQVSLGATAIDQSVTPPKQTYTGPQRLAFNGGVVTEVVQTGDFEAVSNWAIGVHGKPNFRVTAQSAPARLVIDIVTP